MSRPPVQVPPDIADLVRTAGPVVVLTGAGMSAESGVPTFRDVQVGLWERFDPSELATPQAWARDPEQVWAWYSWRATLVRASRPNPGHLALARWQQSAGLSIVTQNVDDLHERAGATVATHLHGDLFALRCADCGVASPAGYPVVEKPVARLTPPGCGACGGPVRPGVVWFGESLPPGAFELAVDLARDAGLVLVVGTSGLVHPAAAVPQLAAAAGVAVVEINSSPTPVTPVCRTSWRTTAAVGLPALVDLAG